MGVPLVFRQARVWSSGSAKHSVVEIGHEIIFYCHSLPTADCTVVSYCWKGVYLVLVNCLGNLPSVDRLTDSSPCVPQVPGYLKTHIIIIITLNTSALNRVRVRETFSPKLPPRLSPVVPEEHMLRLPNMLSSWNNDIIISVHLQDLAYRKIPKIRTPKKLL